jgi:hypothetical protein
MPLPCLTAGRDIGLDVSPRSIIRYREEEVKVAQVAFVSFAITAFR